MPILAMSCPEQVSQASSIGAAADPAVGERSERHPAALPASLDAFYGGAFHLLQPKGRGHRAGLDPLLLAAALPASEAGEVADLGAGTGAVGFALACRCPELRVTLVEQEAAVVGLLRRSLALAENRSLTGRLSVIEADLLALRPVREAAGLRDGAYDAVLTNPPFHPPGDRPSPDVLRSAARSVPDRDFLARWLQVSAALLKPRGILALVARPENLGDIVAGAKGRLGDLRVMPVHSRAGLPAIRILVRARRGSKAGLSLLPGLTLHEAGGELTPLARAVAAGTAELEFEPGR